MVREKETRIVRDFHIYLFSPTMSQVRCNYNFLHKNNLDIFDEFIYINCYINIFFSVGLIGYFIELIMCNHFIASLLNKVIDASEKRYTIIKY